MATKTFNVSFPTPLAKRLDLLARRQQMSRSELLRNATQSYVAWWERWNQMSDDLRQRANKLGIRTEDDIDRIVHEVRDEIAAEKRPAR